MTTIDVHKIHYAGWDNCVQVSNGIIDIVATTDVGPRIIRFGFKGDVNEFCERKDQVGKKGGDEWYIYGGHRLWHSPEAKPRSYIPDNKPVAWSIIDDGIKLSQETEPETHIKKEMEVTMAADKAAVNIKHKLINEGLWPVRLAPWALTVMATGGKEIVPQPQRDTGLLANRLLVLWPYSKMNDHRVYWGDKYITLLQDPDCEPPFKFGLSNEHGWAAYANHGHMFVKRYKHQPDAVYPDFGVSFETYTTDFMTEIESLGPMVELQPGQSVEHSEEWLLFDNISMPSNDEQQIDELIKAVGLS